MNAQPELSGDTEEADLPVQRTRAAIRHEGERIRRVADAVIEEVPVAMVYNGISHAVMLATPGDLEDFALGFSLSEGLIAQPRELRDLDIVVSELGIELRMEISLRAIHDIKETRRQLAGRTGCGLCGKESLQQAILPVPTVNRKFCLKPEALRRALDRLPELQTLQGSTGGAHGAAWVRPDGEIEFLREDVGRHNALDKLLGALFARRIDPGTGFVLMTSRASHELVHKTATAGVELLATLSAPTGLAVDNAQKAGLTLLSWMREGRFSVYTHPERVADGA
jgi:formate dehydrogenase accessory protein FdhD